MNRTVCPNCQGRSLSFIAQRQADGSWAPGEGQRCDNCKAAFLPVTNESTEQGVREAVQPVTQADALAFANEAFRNIVLPRLSSAEMRDIEGALRAFSLRRHRQATLSPDDIRREEASVPMGITFAIAYLDGALEGEQAEILKQWHKVRDFVSPAICSQPSREGEK